MSYRFGGSFLAAVASAGVVAAHPAAAETLADAITAAYDTNPSLQAQRALQRALDEEYVQARAGWRPTLVMHASANYQYLRTPASELFRLQRYATIERANAGALDFTLDQPIWTGGRTDSAVNAANADVLAGRETLRRLEGQLMQQVVQAYADVRRDQQAVAVRQADLEVLAGQLTENQARFDVGEVTRTDVAQAQARYAGSQALLEAAQAQLEVSRGSFASLVGHNPTDLEPEPSLAYLMPATIDQAFDIADQNSPLIRAQLYSEQASRARVAGARAEHMPNISLETQLRFGNGSFQPFLQHQYDTEQTAGLMVTVPLFAGGQINSRVRQAIERNNADRITVETQRRAVLLTITQDWNLLLSARANIVSTDQQVEAAKIAAEGTHEEQQVGLRTTIDVLNAELELRAAQIAEISARHDEYVATAGVLTAMGRLEARNLIPNQPIYDPAANFRRLRVTWGWVPWEEPISTVDRALAFPAIPQAHEIPGEKAIGPGLQAQPVARSQRPDPSATAK
jgi:outer membrane protein